ncbi:MAG: MBL fold metallo-hydrolase [Oscillospiraceae bacterium]|nr:MBL fold metallo-hydrolase [Oscillospiraceae bacterium]
MMRLYPLFSSSGGNSAYIGTKEEGILIDCGAACKRITAALDASGIPLSSVKAVFITHEHTDHIKGLKIFTKNTGIPVYSRERTLDELFDKGHILSRAVEIKDGADVAGMHITFFETPHDAVSPCGFRIETDNGACAVCTDLGEVTDEVMRGITGVNAILLEANYDEEMLRTGPYPYDLKRRISCGIGHLSNRQSAETALRLVRSGTTDIILGHLSQNNNTPSAALATVADFLSGEGLINGRDYMMTAAPRETPPTGADFVTFG